MKRSPENEIQISEKQTNFKPSKGKNIQVKNSFKLSNSEELEDPEVPVRKFTPLPNIPRIDDGYYRTESYLIQSSINDMSRPSGALPVSNTKNDSSLIMNTKHDAPQKHELKSIINFDNKHTKWETRYHFAQKKSSNKRLPALDKQYNLHQAMDLDEDLPVNPVSTSKHQNQRVAYTSPGERIISPVKRPSAPSPPASSYFKYNEKNSDSEAENSL